jgi:hypothetical protein
MSDFDKFIREAKDEFNSVIGDPDKLAKLEARMETQVGTAKDIMRRYSDAHDKLIDEDANAIGYLISVIIADCCHIDDVKAIVDMGLLVREAMQAATWNARQKERNRSAVSAVLLGQPPETHDNDNDTDTSS